MEWIFAILLGVYLVILLIIGLRSRSGSDPEDFFIASRSLSHRSVAYSIGATVVGGSAVIVTGSLVFAYGLSGLWYDIGGVIGLLFLGLFVAPKLRRTRAHSLPDLVGMKYGDRSKVAASLLLILVEIGWVALLLQATKFVMTIALGISSDIALILSASVFIGYTVIGGQKAVVRTDKLQMILAVGALGAILVGMLFQGGKVPDSALDFPITDGFTPSLAISAFIIMFLSHVVGPDIYSKVFSSRSVRASRYGVIGGALFKLLSSLLVASIALIGIFLYGSSISGGSLIPTAAMDTLPPLIFSIAMVGIVSVMLSSADSCLISGATFLSWDLLKGIKTKYSRIFGVVGLGVMAYLLAFYSAGILETLTLSYTLFSAGMVPSVFLIPWKEKLRLTSNGAISSFIIGGGGVVILYSLSKFDLWTGSLLYIPLGLSFISLLLFSWILPKKTSVQ